MIIIQDMMLPAGAEIPRGPPYITVHVTSATEHVYSVLPPYLQGTSGLVQLITAFLGTGQIWVRVSGDINTLYTNRDSDLYFLFWVCSHILPIPTSLPVLRSQWSGTKRMTYSERTSCVDKGSQLLPIGQHGLFYTRTGHLGTLPEMHRYSRSVTWHGYVTHVKPRLSHTGKRIVIITNRVHHWVDDVDADAHTLVIHVDTIHQLDPTMHWDSVILDNLCTSTPSIANVYSRQLRGWISPEWVRITDAVPFRRESILYTELRPSDLNLIEYLFLLQTTYNGEECIAKRFTIPTTTLVRVLETLLLEGILDM